MLVLIAAMEGVVVAATTTVVASHFCRLPPLWYGLLRVLFFIGKIEQVRCLMAELAWAGFNFKPWLDGRCA